jgi:hypothetical protein
VCFGLVDSLTAWPRSVSVPPRRVETGRGRRMPREPHEKPVGAYYARRRATILVTRRRDPMADRLGVRPGGAELGMFFCLADPAGEPGDWRSASVLTPPSGGCLDWLVDAIRADLDRCEPRVAASLFLPGRGKTRAGCPSTPVARVAPRRREWAENDLDQDSAPRRKSSARRMGLPVQLS